MKQRLFIAINLPKQLKDKIESEIEKFRYSFTGDIRFLSMENWHITLIFLGYQPSESIPAIIQSMENAVREIAPPKIELTDISYGPKDGPKRMVWLNGSQKTSENLSKIRDELEKELVDSGIRFKMERRRFQTHLTLARFQNIYKDELPHIDTKLPLNFIPASLDLMESHLSRSGANYETIHRVIIK